MAAIQELSVDELYNYLEEVNIDISIRDKICQHKINGEIFMSLGEDELKELAPLIGDRVTLRRMKCEVSQKEGKAKAAFQSLTKANTSIISKLFGSSSRKRALFDALTPIQKKAMKAKSKSVTIILMVNRPNCVPRGAKRNELKASGRVRKLQFYRSMSADAVRQTIAEGFSKNVDKAIFLHCHQNNLLDVYEKQDLNGDELINLADQGCAYLYENASTSVSIEEPESIYDSKTEALLKAADEAAELLRNPSTVEPVEEVSLIEESFMEEEPFIDYDDVFHYEESDTIDLTNDSTEKDTENLPEWRALGRQQEKEYEASLEVDRQKDMEKERLHQNLQRIERVKFLKETFNRKFKGTVAQWHSILIHEDWA